MVPAPGQDPSSHPCSEATPSKPLQSSRAEGLDPPARVKGGPLAPPPQSRADWHRGAASLAPKPGPSASPSLLTGGLTTWLPVTASPGSQPPSSCPVTQLPSRAQLTTADISLALPLSSKPRVSSLL